MKTLLLIIWSGKFEACQISNSDTSRCHWWLGCNSDEYCARDCVKHLHGGSGSKFERMIRAQGKRDEN